MVVGLPVLDTVKVVGIVVGLTVPDIVEVEEVGIVEGL